jgi:hypothetical protein
MDWTGFSDFICVSSDMIQSSKTKNNLIDSLNKVINLQLPGFTKNVPSGEVGQIVFEEGTSGKWYGEFINRIQTSIGKEYLPIYRMADGEFIFCVEWRPELPRGISGFAEKISWKIKGKVKQSFKRFVPGRKTVWGENYSRMNHDELMVHYVRCLKTVSEHGILALHFTRSAGKFSEEYFEPMCNWFETNNIEITPDNYTSFYFVYALLCGPDSKVLIRNRRLLLVTSADDSKRTRIREYLMSLGAKTVQFLRISINRALLDKINLDGIKEPVDLAFVAGGIGSVNILDQIKPLNTVCIDIGICMEIFADPSKRGRIFTQPDQPIV